MIQRILLFCCLLTFQVLAAGLVSYAQTGPVGAAWESKPVDKWDKQDVKDILEESAWSKMIRSKPATSTRVGTFIGDSSIWFTLRSALLIRFAVIRRLQIEQKYDSMPADEQKKFDLANQSVLQCALCSKYYIVSVRGSSSEFLQNAGFVKNQAKNIFLSNEKGEVRVLANYSPPSGSMSEAMFFFPRLNAEGKPLFTKDNEKLRFNLNVTGVDDPVVESIRKVEINIQDIVRSGQVIF